MDSKKLPQATEHISTLTRVRDRRRPGRKTQVSPHLIPLLRSPTTMDGPAPIGKVDVSSLKDGLAPTRGVIVSPVSASLLDAALDAARTEFVIQLADTPALVEEAYRLRYQVYCLERGYEPAQDGREVDGYDGHSSHVLLRLAASGLTIGTARLILPDAAQPRESFPVQGLIADDGLTAVPFMRTAEISRFSISKERRGPSTAASSVSHLALVRGLVQLSHQQGLTHWCAVMERTLLRLLQRSGIHFQNIGPMVEYHGLRQPVYCNLAHMLARMREEQPGIWSFITEHESCHCASPPQP